MSPQRAILQREVFELDSVGATYIGTLNEEIVGFTDYQMRILVESGVADYVEPEVTVVELNSDLISRFVKAVEALEEANGDWAGHDVEHLQSAVLEMASSMKEALK